MQIQVSWLLQKPTDLDLHCLQRQAISRFSRTRVKNGVLSKQQLVEKAWLYDTSKVQIKNIFMIFFINFVPNICILRETIEVAALRYFERVPARNISQLQIRHFFQPNSIDTVFFLKKSTYCGCT